jgi:pantoate--beta-alanine ligase
MKIVHRIEDLRDALAGAQRPAFVPTMGNLHKGHLALIRQAARLGDCTVASIFVNRPQFLPHEDFDRYPRTWESDCAALKSVGCDVLFAPGEADLYPQPQTFRIRPDPELSNILEGHFRPGFFEGVSTVVMKLFMSVFLGKRQGVTLFGLKDYQQFLVIKALVKQFALPIEVVGGPIVRDDDGLALSSRNAYLSADERQRASLLYRSLSHLVEQFKLEQHRNRLDPRNESDQARYQQWVETLEAAAKEKLSGAGWHVDYLCLRRQDNLQLPGISDPTIALAAAKLGTTRLIDNLAC